MQKTASVTLLPAREGDAARREDYFRTSQLTYNNQFVHQQRRMSSYQRTLDNRLSQPKFTRPRIVNKKLKASLVQLN